MRARVCMYVVNLSQQHKEYSCIVIENPVTPGENPDRILRSVSYLLVVDELLDSKKNP